MRREKGDTNMANTQTQERVISAREAHDLYLKRYGRDDGITPEEYNAELEYLYEVFGIKPRTTLYTQARKLVRSR